MSGTGRLRPMHVGLSRARFLRGLRINLVLGVLPLVAGVVAWIRAVPNPNAPGTLGRLGLLVFLFIVPSGIWMILGAILCSITLRVENGAVAQVLWRRFVLKRQRLADLTRVTGGDLSAMVLHFREGKKIALPGIHAEDRHRFLEDLDRLRPDLGLLDG
jgi:hypothetical protein